MATQCRSNAVDNLRAGKHANLDSIDADVAHYRINLRLNHIQVNALDLSHTQGVLRSNSGHHRHAIST